MKLRPCPFCSKPIPSRMTTCPYCHRDEQGQAVAMDTTAPLVEESALDLDKDLKLLESDDAFVQEQVSSRIVQKSFSASLPLIAILQEMKSPVLAPVARILGRIGDKRAIAALAQAARGGDDELRMAALWALAQFREPEVLPVLLSEAERVHPVTQSYLVHVLGGFQSVDVIPVLAKLINSSNAEVAFHAATALGGYATPAAIQGLRAGVRRRDPLVRAAAISSLRRLGLSPMGTAGLFWKIGVSGVLVIVGILVWWIYR